MSEANGLVETTTGTQRVEPDPEPLNHGHHGFDTPYSLTLAGRLNRLGNEMVSTYPARLLVRLGSTGFGAKRPVSL